MSTESMNLFLSKAQTDLGLQASIHAALKESPKAFMLLAQANGFDISADDIQAMNGDSRLNDQQLDSVSGGGMNLPSRWGPPPFFFTQSQFNDLRKN